MNSNNPFSGSPLQATHWGELQIGNVVFQCAVLADGTRVLTRATFVKALGRKGKVKGGRKYDSEFQLPPFLSAQNLSAFITESAMENSKPVLFEWKGSKFIGYRAEFLPSVCGVFLDAQIARRLRPNQEHIAAQCRILIDGFSTVGIVALVDEATGYQYDRARDALAELLQNFLRDKIASWARAFPDEFYKEMFRLRNLSYSEFTTKRPLYFGKLTNDVVYERLAPGVLDELRARTPKTDRGNRKGRFHQWLTDDVGHPALKEHLTAVTTLMKASTSWPMFYRLLERAKPKHTLQAKLLDVPEEEFAY